MELVRTHPEPTFKYFYIGSVTIVIGFLTASLSILIGLCIVLIGIFAVLSVKGVHIDPNTKQVKSYFNFMFIKLGNWIPLSEFTHIVLGPNSSSKTLSKFSSTTVKTRSYSVYLLTKNNTRLELREFIEYHLAEHYLYQTANQIGLQAVNKEELTKKVAAEKRPFRRL